MINVEDVGEGDVPGRAWGNVCLSIRMRHVLRSISDESVGDEDRSFGSNCVSNIPDVCEYLVGHSVAHGVIVKVPSGCPITLVGEREIMGWRVRDSLTW